MSKFKMKGHSIPGIKGFKSTSKKEDISAGTYGGQSGVNFALQEIIKAKKRLNTPEAKEAREANKKAREEKKAKRQTEKLEKKQYKDSEKVQVGLNLDE